MITHKTKTTSIRTLIAGVLILVMALAATDASAAYKREMRGVWVSTAWCLDWPTKSNGSALQGTSSSVVTQQKNRLCEIMDSMKVCGFNAIFFQVRPMGDALYKSSWEPVSSYLTGSRGSSLPWDPLAYAVTYAHKIGLELHAWVNPYRWAGKNVNWSTAWDKEVDKRGWLLRTAEGTIYNPGLPEVRQHIVNVCHEIISKYEVDGLVFDDYFYTNPTPTDSTVGDYSLWKNSGTSLSIAAWRRQNVNQMVEDVYNMVQATKPYVRFGISPAGVAKGGAKDAGLTPMSVGSDWQYNGIYSDPIAWLKAGTIDYISPQIYWNTDHATNPFGTITEWWAKTAKALKRHHFASHSISALASSNTKEDWGEYARQVQLTRTKSTNKAPGAVFFRCNFLCGPNASGLGAYLQRYCFGQQAILPEITWKEHETYGTVSDLSLNKGKLSWSFTSSDPVRYTVYAIPSSVTWSKAQRSDKDGINEKYLLGMSYSKSYTLPADKQEDYYYAVAVLDGYSHEYEAITIEPTAIGGIMAEAFSFTLRGRMLCFSVEFERVDIYDMNGRQLAPFSDGRDINVDLPGGIYIVKATAKDSQRLVDKIRIR